MSKKMLKIKRGNPRANTMSLILSNDRHCTGNSRLERGFLPTSRTKLLPVAFYLLSIVMMSACVPEGIKPEIASSEETTAVAALQHRHHHGDHLDSHHPQRRVHLQPEENGDMLTDIMANETAPIVEEESVETTGNEFTYAEKFWIRVAQAKAMALVVESGIEPKLAESSQIMKAASCYEDDTVCKDFVGKCATDAANQLYEDLKRDGHNFSSANVNNYMRRIVSSCNMNSYLPSDGSQQGYDDTNYQILPQPLPVFHCNSHIGRKVDYVNYETFFRMEYPGTIHEPPGTPSELVPRFFVIEIEEHGHWEMLSANSVQPFWLYRIHTRVGVTYRVRVTAVSPKFVYPPVISSPITLYDAAAQTIGKPINFRVENVTLDEHAARPNPIAFLRWNSGSGFNASCDFDIFHMADDVNKVERKKADESFWVKLELDFGREYGIRIIEKFGVRRESEPLIAQLKIPSCLELRGFSFEHCPPPPPTNLKLVNATEHSFWIAWDPPKYTNIDNKIANYSLVVSWMYSDGGPHSSPTDSGSKRIFEGTVAGNRTSQEIKNTMNLRGRFRVTVTANGASGPSSELWNFFEYKGSSVSGWTAQRILTLFFALFGVMSIIGLFWLLKNLHERHQRKKKRQEKFENYEKESLQLSPIDRDDSKWEIDCCSLLLGEPIGEGYFGQVRKAILNQKGRKLTVAVKMLRDGGDDKDVGKFWEEFEILKNLDPPSVHVVSLVGIVKKHFPLLVVEYCDGGNLQNHLRKAFQTNGTGKKYSPGFTWNSGSSLVHSNSGNRIQVNVATNEAYFMKEDIEDSLTLTTVDLLSYSRQIACGMEFLSTNKIVHRDLAARNILVSGKTRILKISDFGLSRDIYEQNWYKKSSNGRIPVKWLAVECLLKELYTTKSDVWSYGILLWEIFTYGGNPYPGVESNNVFDLLKNGYRMPRPEHCPEDLYELMSACWEEEPCDRPDFTSIRLILEDIIEKTSQVTYLNLECPAQSPLDHVDYGTTYLTDPILSRRPLPQIPLQTSQENCFNAIH